MMPIAIHPFNMAVLGFILLVGGFMMGYEIRAMIERKPETK